MKFWVIGGANCALLHKEEKHSLTATELTRNYMVKFRYNTEVIVTVHENSGEGPIADRRNHDHQVPCSHKIFHDYVFARKPVNFIEANASFRCRNPGPHKVRNGETRVPTA